MDGFTYEKNDISRKLENFEWDNVWWEQTANASAKRIAYIGDSISCGTRRLIIDIVENGYNRFGRINSASDKLMLVSYIRLQ